MAENAQPKDNRLEAYLRQRQADLASATLQAEQQANARALAAKQQADQLKFHSQAVQQQLDAAHERILARRDAIQAQQEATQGSQQQPEPPPQVLDTPQINPGQPGQGDPSQLDPTQLGPQVTQTAGGPQPGPPGAAVGAAPPGGGGQSMFSPGQGTMDAFGLGQGPGGTVGGFQVPPYLVSASQGSVTRPEEVSPGVRRPQTSFQQSTTAKPNALTAESVLRLRALASQFMFRQQIAQQSLNSLMAHRLELENQGRARLGLASALVGIRGAVAQSEIAKNQYELMAKQAEPFVQNVAALQNRTGADINTIMQQTGVPQAMQPFVAMHAQGLQAAVQLDVDKKTAMANMADAQKTQRALGTVQGPLEQVFNIDPKDVAGPWKSAKAAITGARESIPEGMWGHIDPDSEQGKWATKYWAYWKNAVSNNAATLSGAFPGQRAIGIEAKLVNANIETKGMSPGQIQAITGQQMIAWNLATVRTALWNSSPANMIHPAESFTPDMAMDAIMQTYDQNYAKTKSFAQAADATEQQLGLGRNSGRRTIRFISTMRKQGEDAALALPGGEIGGR